MTEMSRVAYANDGTSIYDTLFLKHLTKQNLVYFLTFNHNPEFVWRRAMLVKMPFSLPAKSRIEGLLMFTLWPIRAFILKLWLRSIKPQAVLGCLATKYGFYVALSGFYPIILVVWGSDILIGPERFLLARFMVKFALRRANAVIVDSEVQKDAAKRLGCNPEKILKFAWFDPSDIEVRCSKHEIRKELGWENNLIVVCSRSHEPIYGLTYLLEAIPHVVKRIPRCRFLMLGSGSLSGKLERRVHELEIEQFVRFMGQVPHDNVVTYLNAGDVYVSPSLSDGTSACLLEAMVSKLPVVVTDIPGNREWVRDGWSGYLVPVKDAKSLEEKIVLLLKDQDLRQRLSINALKTVKMKTEGGKTFELLNNLISQLVHKRYENAFGKDWKKQM